MNQDKRLKEAGKLMRELALDFDRQYQAVVERGFQFWQNDTLWPAAVNRWTAEIGEQS